VAARKSIRVQGEVDGVAWSWAGPTASASSGYGHFGVGDESPPSLALTLWPASIGLKILGRGKLSLACSSVSSTKRRQLPLTQSSPTCILLFSSI
jgi:hypothetical protein